MGGPAQGACRPELVEDGGLGRDRTRLPYRTSATISRMVPAARESRQGPNGGLAFAGIVDGDRAHITQTRAHHVQSDLL